MGGPMLRIRLTRMGRKNLAVYRVAVFDQRMRRDGPYIERLGDYDPKVKEPAKKMKVNVERLKYWVGKGAQPTPALAAILKHVGVSTEAKHVEKTAKTKK